MSTLNIYALKAQYRPGELISLRVEWPQGLLDPGARIEVVISEIHRVVMRLAADVDPCVNQVNFEWPAPDQHYVAFGLDARALTADGEVRATGSGAVDVAEAWWQTPRMGFMAEFSAGETLTETRRRMQMMARLHVTCLHFYDWMYTHHQYLAPEDNFVDSMGRHLSTLVVRRKVRLAKELGMAPLAYAPLYGAEEAFYQEHPEWALYRTDGEAFNVARLFYIMDFRLGSGWTEHLLEQYRQAVKAVGFAGLIIDQFGSPKKALPYPGTYGTPPIDLSDHFAPLIDAADTAIREVDSEARVVFHAMNNWPMRKVASSRQVVTYIQVYSPHRTYRDLRDLISRALALAPEKPVVLGALWDPATGSHAMLLLMATIHACGGYQLLLGEGEGVLTSGYFPDYVALDSDLLPRVQAYHDFIVRFGPLMHAAQEQDVSETHAGGVTEEYSFSGAPVSSSGLPGHVWTIVREHVGMISMQLINLLHSDGIWHRPQAVGPPVEGLVVTCRMLEPVSAVYVASPDWEDGSLVPLEFESSVDPQSGRIVRFAIPSVAVWTTVLILLSQ